uniref:Uncharacterized protein n=1 Tax=Ananas comosus var. bracteatus TaxID=296719 RepID=A0A6V7PHE2_ANACO|nr:unnamed protein product [Ananas comosus var. bracteatus]
MDRPLEPFLGPSIISGLSRTIRTQNSVSSSAPSPSRSPPSPSPPLLRRHPRHPENRSRVPPQALGRDHPPRGVRQRPETPAELRHEVVRREPPRHRRSRSSYSAAIKTGRAFAF